MAYIKAEQVKSIRDQIKQAYPKYKWSVTRRHHTTVVIVLRESDLPYDGQHIQVNQYYLKETEKLNTKAKLIFQHVMEICNSVERCYNRNAGDMGADYADNTYFIDLDIGEWDKPHKTISADFIRHPFSNVGKVLTPEEIENGQKECERVRAALPDMIELSEPVKKSIPGWIPHLGLSIIEEVIV